MDKENSSQVIKLAFCILIPLFILMMPSSWIPINDLTVVQHRLLAIFVMSALLWVLEPVPVFATSILIITLE
ncbi:dihydroorotate dehydrogenase, partial [Vibrio lentus]